MLVNGVSVANDPMRLKGKSVRKLLGRAFFFNKNSVG